MSPNVSQPPLIDSDNKPNLPTDNGETNLFIYLLLLQNFISLVLSFHSNLFDFTLCFSTGVSAAVSHSVSSYGRVLVSGPAIFRANPTVSLFKV